MPIRTYSTNQLAYLYCWQQGCTYSIISFQVEILTRLEHPNIICIYGEVVDKGNEYFIVTGQQCIHYLKYLIERHSTKGHVFLTIGFIN
jgi:hypothetical protein